MYRKCELPNYAVFDELRYFARGHQPEQLYRIAGVPVGVSICEDAWNPSGPIADQADSGAEVILNLNASPYAEGKQAQRERMLATRAADASCSLVYVNQVGGQDELVFDGGSVAFDSDGELLARSPQFVEDLLVVDLDVQPVYRKRLLDPRGRPSDEQLPLVELARVTDVTSSTPDPTTRRQAPIADLLGCDEEVYEALVLGTRDYVEKNGFSDVVIGLSGGIDSTLVAVIAVDALGADRVHGVSMPSRYSSDHSRSDAEKLASNLGIDYRTIAIEPAHAAVLEMLAPSFEGLEPDLTEENLQSRIRGQVLMALSNKFGWLVLTTGNKSEMAVGYATLYGDTVRWLRRAQGRAEDPRVHAVPHAQRAGRPRADPRGGDHQAAVGRAAARPARRPEPAALRGPRRGARASTSSRTARRPRSSGRVSTPRSSGGWPGWSTLAEYKRRQTPPGPRVSAKAFGKDRRLPITNGYRGLEDVSDRRTGGPSTPSCSISPGWSSPPRSRRSCRCSATSCPSTRRSS